MTVIASKLWRSVIAIVAENLDNEVTAYIAPRPKNLKGSSTISPAELNFIIKHGDALTISEAESIFPDLSRIVWGKWKKA
jgi:hypothetical protein